MEGIADRTWRWIFLVDFLMAIKVFESFISSNELATSTSITDSWATAVISFCCLSIANVDRINHLLPWKNHTLAIDSDLVPSVSVSVSVAIAVPIVPVAAVSVAVAILLKPLLNVLEVVLKVWDLLAIASSITVQDSSLE